MVSNKRLIVVYIEQARIPNETTSITRSEVPIAGDIVIEESVKAYLIFQAVAEAEKIKVTDADVSDYFGDDSLSVQQAQKYYGEEYVNQTVLYNKVGDWLTAHATIV